MGKRKQWIKQNPATTTLCIIAGAIVIGIIVTMIIFKPVLLIIPGIVIGGTGLGILFIKAELEYDRRQKY